MPRFTLRDIFWLTLMVAMGVALYLAHQRDAKLREEAVRADWKMRILEQQARAEGWTIKDDGAAFTFSKPSRTKLSYKPDAVEQWSEDGTHISVTKMQTP